MTRADLIQKLAERFTHPRLADADMSVRVIPNAIAQKLAHGHRAELRGFGSFSPRQRAPRKGRDPRTGTSVMVPQKYVPHFKAGKEMRLRVLTD